MGLLYIHTHIYIYIYIYTHTHMSANYLTISNEHRFCHNQTIPDSGIRTGVASLSRYCRVPKFQAVLTAHHTPHNTPLTAHNTPLTTHHSQHTTHHTAHHTLLTAHHTQHITHHTPSPNDNSWTIASELSLKWRRPLTS